VTEPGAPPDTAADAVPDAVPDVVVDCLGRPCPVPVVELARAVAAAPEGAVVEVLSDDPAARHDVPAWARMRGQEYLGEVERGRGAGYRVRRR
jgi:cysteine desulfurase